MKRLLVTACVAGLAIAGVSVRAAETTSEPTETGAPAAAANSSLIKSSHLKTASTKAGKPAKTRVPLPAPKPAEAEAADTDAQPELQAEATPADMQATEQPAADATPEARPDPAGQAAEAKPDDKKLDDKKPSYMRTGHPEIDALVATHARANNVPEALVHRVIVRESKYQKDLVGSCGCIGLMQIKLGTARGLGYTGDAKGLHDPNTNLMYGVKYLAGAYRAANGDHDRAVSYFAKGYYEVAKRQRLADARPFGRPERVHAPLDITPKADGAIHVARHVSRALGDKQATASR